MAKGIGSKLSPSFAQGRTHFGFTGNQRLKTRIGIWCQENLQGPIPACHYSCPGNFYCRNRKCLWRESQIIYPVTELPLTLTQTKLLPRGPLCHSPKSVPEFLNVSLSMSLFYCCLSLSLFFSHQHLAMGFSPMQASIQSRFDLVKED